MSDYIKHKEYKLPNGRTVTADFNELGCAMVTIQAMDALFDILNSSVEVVRCKDCKNYRKDIPCVGGQYNGCAEWLDEGCEAPVEEDDYCSYGKKRDD